MESKSDPKKEPVQLDHCYDRSLRPSSIVSRTKTSAKKEPAAPKEDVHIDHSYVQVDAQRRSDRIRRLCTGVFMQQDRVQVEHSYFQASLPEYAGSVFVSDIQACGEGNRVGHDHSYILTHVTNNRVQLDHSYMTKTASTSKSSDFCTSSSTSSYSSMLGSGANALAKLAKLVMLGTAG